MVPSGEEGRGMGLGRDIQGSLIVFVMFKKSLKDNQMLKFGKAGWWVSQVFVIFFIIFFMFLIFYNLKVSHLEKTCQFLCPYSK